MLYCNKEILISTKRDFCAMKNKTSSELNKDIMTIYEALCEKGYDPVKQIAGYILSEDPVYITDWKNARGIIQHINRAELLFEFIQSYVTSNSEKK